MNYNMKLRLKAEIEDDLARVTRLEKMHAANATEYAVEQAVEGRKKKISDLQKHHSDMAMAYEWMAQALNQYLLQLEKLDDDIKWTLFHLRNLQDLPNETIKTTLKNIESVIIEWNYIMEDK